MGGMVKDSVHLASTLSDGPAEHENPVERTPITDLATLSEQDERDMLSGYWAGYHGREEPGVEFNRAYWHGWRNGMVDGGHKQSDAAQVQLAHVLYGKRREP